MALFEMRSQKQSCASCRFFLDDPISFEQALPGICILSSGQGDTKGNQGICTVHQQLAVPRMSCKHYKLRANE